MSEVKLFTKFFMVRIMKPIEVICPHNGKEHLITIDRFYVIDDVAHGYCKEHELFFCIDADKTLLGWRGSGRG